MQILDAVDAASLRSDIPVVHPGDTVILIGYGQMDTAEAKEHQPHVVFVDTDNKIMATGYDPAETFGDKALTRGDLVDR